MPTDITIDSIAGTSPFDVYICDLSNCYYVDTISSVPYTFQVPPALDGLTSYDVKIVDSGSCSIIKTIT
jgi:hypothetical protein